MEETGRIRRVDRRAEPRARPWQERGFLGGAETTMNLHDAYQRLALPKSGCYYRPEPQEGR
jgi:hypothetical protein